jgi:hypothetical protein
MRGSVLQVFRSSLFSRRESLPEELDRGAEITYFPIFWSSVSVIFRWRPQVRPEGLEFNQSRLNHTRFALTTQSIDDLLLRSL